MFKSRKEELLTDIRTIQKSLHETGENRKKYAKSWAEFGRFLRNSVVSQSPQVTNLMDRIQGMFNEIADLHIKFSEEEIRNSEDFGDVAERFNVVFRENQEYIEKKREYTGSCGKLKEALAKLDFESKKPEFEKEKAKLEANVEKARNEKRKCLEDVKTQLKRLIDIREKYNKFKVRRFCQGFTRYGLAMKEEGEKEAEVLLKMKDLFLEMKSFVEIDEKDLNRIENALEEHIMAAPAPQVNEISSVVTRVDEAEEELLNDPPFSSETPEYALDLDKTPDIADEQQETIDLETNPFLNLPQ